MLIHASVNSRELAMRVLSYSSTRRGVHRVLLLPDRSTNDMALPCRVNNLDFNSEDRLLSYLPLAHIFDR